MQIQSITEAGAAAAPLEVSDETFGVPYNESLIHQVVVAYMAGARAGTAAQKTRSEVRGGGAKPWRQKGTGRARHGSIRSPIWRGGGVTFAAKPRSYAQKVNRKMYRGAMRSIVSELVREERLTVADLVVSEPKTRALVAKLSAMGLADVLILVEAQDDNLALASRNLHRVGVLEAREVTPVDLLSFERVLCTPGALRALEARLAGTPVESATTGNAGDE